MKILTLEHGKLAYYGDFAVYGGLVMALGAVLAVAPRAQDGAIAVLALLGLAGWSIVEYLMHRFVLHGIGPFEQMHAAHHARPQALIATPTLFSVASIALLVFLPAFLVSNLWRASALTLGVTLGYLAYSVMHHALHFWSLDWAWFIRQRRWHAQHHGRGTGSYGVTNHLWDRIFGTILRRPGPKSP